MSDNPDYPFPSREPCGRGVCAANDGHPGTCEEASGWTPGPADAPGSRPNAILPHAQPERAPTDHRARAEAYKAERDRARDLAAHLEQDAHTTEEGSG